MTPMKTFLMTAAMMAVPAGAFAQISTDAMTDKVKDKAVDTVMDNMTADDAMVAGKTLIKGGSKEDAAMAVVKNRVEDKIDGMTGAAVPTGDMSKDGMMDAAKDMAKDKMMDKVEGHSSATSYGDKAASSAKTYGSAVIPKTGVTTTTTPAPTMTAPTMTAPAPAAMTPVNCPSGTTAQADGTCMITGNWNG